MRLHRGNSPAFPDGKANTFKQVQARNLFANTLTYYHGLLVATGAVVCFYIRGLISTLELAEAAYVKRVLHTPPQELSNAEAMPPERRRTKRSEHDHWGGSAANAHGYLDEKPRKRDFGGIASATRVVPERNVFNPESLAARESLPRVSVIESDNPVAAALIRSDAHQERVTIVYAGGSEPGESRTISPSRGFRVEGCEVVFVSASCHRRDAERVFRLDRVQALTEPVGGISS